MLQNIFRFSFGDMAVITVYMSVKSGQNTAASIALESDVVTGHVIFR